MSIFGQKVGRGMAKRLAKQIPKEDFIDQLKQEWDKSLPKNGSELDIDLVVDGSMQRIRESGLGEAFDIVGITREDLVEALKEVMGKPGGEEDEGLLPESPNLGEAIGV